MQVYQRSFLYVVLPADCKETSWPGGGGLGVILENAANYSDVSLTVMRSTFDRCSALCDGVGSSDFLTSCGGGTMLLRWFEAAVGL